MIIHISSFHRYSLEALCPPLLLQPPTPYRRCYGQAAAATAVLRPGSLHPGACARAGGLAEPALVAVALAGRAGGGGGGDRVPHGALELRGEVV